MHPVFATILKRLFLGLVTLFIVSVIIFTSIQMLPGDFGEAILGQAATDETVAAFRKELGLDKPALWRYFDRVGALAAGDLGNSFSGRAGSGIDRSRAVIDLVAPGFGIRSFSPGCCQTNYRKHPVSSHYADQIVI